MIFTNFNTIEQMILDALTRYAIPHLPVQRGILPDYS